MCPVSCLLSQEVVDTTVFKPRDLHISVFLIRIPLVTLEQCGMHCIYLLSLFISYFFWPYIIFRLDGHSPFPLLLTPLGQAEKRGRRLLLETSQGEIQSAVPLGMDYSLLGKLIPHPSDLQEGLP